MRYNNLKGVNEDIFTKYLEAKPEVRRKTDIFWTLRTSLWNFGRVNTVRKH